MTNIDFGSNRIVLPKPDRIRASVRSEVLHLTEAVNGLTAHLRKEETDPVQPRARDGKFSQKKFLLSG